ncbi:MAG: secondary thiamine-phosphate synthase enzyme YjbQ [Pseudomonadota bacterium]
MSNPAEFAVDTRGRAAYNVTSDVQARVAASGVAHGLCHIFLKHTSASLTLCENADPDVLTDFETFLSRLVPDGDPMFLHNAEGPDDMPAHIRSMLTRSDLTIPVMDGRCALGTWQGIFLLEHRSRPHQRKLIVTVQSS